VAAPVLFLSLYGRCESVKAQARCKGPEVRIGRHCSTPCCVGHRSDKSRRYIAMHPFNSCMRGRAAEGFLFGPALLFASVSTVQCLTVLDVALTKPAAMSQCIVQVVHAWKCCSRLSLEPAHLPRERGHIASEDVQNPTVTSSTPPSVCYIDTRSACKSSNAWKRPQAAAHENFRNKRTRRSADCCVA
jgi:hypothetical protein